MKKTKLTWFETEYIRNDATVQPVLVDGVLLYTLYEIGYNYLFCSILELMQYIYGGERTYIETFETEDELVSYLERNIFSNKK